MTKLISLRLMNFQFIILLKIVTKGVDHALHLI